MSVKPGRDGMARQWVKCRTCGHISYYDYVPYSLSRPIMTMPCGHGIGERDMGADRISEKEAERLLSAPEAPQPRDDGMPASSDERHLRRLLAARVAMPNTYFDDGEAHGAEHGIQIDFMREPVAHIDAKLRALNVARLAVAAPQPAQQPLTEISTKHGPWVESKLHEGETYCRRCLTRSVFAGNRECDPHIVSAPAEQPAQPADDEGDALTIAYLHGHGKGQDSVQPVLSEKDALLRRALEVLENLQSQTHDGMNGEFRICCATRPDEPHVHCEASTISESIRTHLGVEP